MNDFILNILISGIWFFIGIFFITLTMNAKLKDMEAEKDNAELRAVTHFRKLQDIENILKEDERNGIAKTFTVENIKEALVNDRKSNN